MLVGRNDDALAMARGGAVEGLDLQRLPADPLMAPIAERAEWAELVEP